MELNLIRQSPNYSDQNSTNGEVQEIDRNIDEVALTCRKFTAKDDEKLEKLLNELDKVVDSKVEISEAEKEKIYQAIGFSKGHWYKCPNGHIYDFGECAVGEMRESKCKECGPGIKESDRLLPDKNKNFMKPFRGILNTQ